MKQITLSTFILLLSLNTQAQGILPIETNGGYLNFNLLEVPDSSLDRQEVSLYGCNTSISTRQLVWDNKKNLVRGVKDQVFPQIPYGYREEAGKSYYISKYYIASPPVMPKQKGYLPVDIGLVTPDNFTLFGEKPVQLVYLDYTILKPVYLNYVNANYGYDDGVHPTCDSLGLNLLPINIQCDDFDWKNKVETPIIFNAKGASGVARMLNEENQNRLFLPSKNAHTDYLNCTITILDDILLNHEVFFVKNDSLLKTISLTDYYTDSTMVGTDIQLSCRVRTELPAGCKKAGE